MTRSGALPLLVTYNNNILHCNKYKIRKSIRKRKKREKNQSADCPINILLGVSKKGTLFFPSSRPFSAYDQRYSPHTFIYRSRSSTSSTCIVSFVAYKNPLIPYLTVFVFVYHAVFSYLILLSFYFRPSPKHVHCDLRSAEMLLNGWTSITIYQDTHSKTILCKNYRDGVPTEFQYIFGNTHDTSSTTV